MADLNKSNNSDKLDKLCNEHIKRPFFSIIVPCYNTKEENMCLLLDSVSKQNMDDEIEVIISNDRSTETAFLDVIKDEKYKELSIKVVDVPDDEDLIHCPGNTREVGVQEATGEWITFVDHDDELIPNSFKEIKNALKENGEQYIASANFYEINPFNGEILNEFIHSGNWMHGKFYNLDNFWKAFNFHYKKNLRTHEDILISSRTKCELDRLKKESPFYIETFCLLWKAWPDSTSRVGYNTLEFLEGNFKDYIASTMDYYLDDYFYSVNELKDQSEENVYNHLRSCLDVLMYMYFYVQGFKFKNKFNYNRENEFLLYQYKQVLCKIFNINADFIYQCVSVDGDAAWYNSVRKSSMIGVGNFIEQESFFDFLFKH